MSWLTRIRRPEPAHDFAPELIDAHRRIRAAKARLRVLMVRLSADRRVRDTDEYMDLALDVARALDGGQ